MSRPRHTVYKARGSGAKRGEEHPDAVWKGDSVLGKDLCSITGRGERELLTVLRIPELL